MRRRATIVTPLTVLMVSFAGCYFLSMVVGLWAAYDFTVALERFALIAFGLAVMFGLGWAGQRHSKTVLSWVGFGCGWLTALISGAYWTGSLTNSGMVASGLMVLLPLGAIHVVWQWILEQRRQALFGALPLLVGAVGLIATQERTAWFGLAAGLLFAGLLYVRFNNNSMVWQCRVTDMLLVLGCGATIILYWRVLVDPSLDSRLALWPGFDLVLERLSLWRESLDLIQDYRFSGSGLGSTAMVYSTYVYLLHVPYFYHAHNLYLQVTLEQGLPGLITFGGLLISAVAGLVISYRNAGPNSRLFCLATLISLSGLLVYGLADAEVYATQFVPILFVPLGFAIALYWSVQQRPYVREATAVAPGHRAFRSPWRGVAALTPLLAVALLLFWPGSLAALYANLGAVVQTKAELSQYHWPEWPIQDELRRTGAVDLSLAMSYYAAALAVDRANVTAHKRLGQIALSQGEYHAAVQHLSAAYRVAPEPSNIRLLLGEANAVSGDMGEAVALWRTVETYPGQLDHRLWWYRYHQAFGEAEKIGAVIARIAQ